jgi:hypothetical protein
MVYTRRTAKNIVDPPPPPPSSSISSSTLEQKVVNATTTPQLSLDERLSILSRPKNVTQPVLKRVPSSSSSSTVTTVQPVTKRPSLATMKSAGSFANVPAKTDSGRRSSSIDLHASASAAITSTASEVSALASLTKTDSLHKLISAPPPPPSSTYKYVSSSGYGQAAGAPVRRTSIIVAAANAKASMSTVKPAPPPSSSKASSSSVFNRSSSFTRRASFSTSQLSLSFVAASTRKPSASLSRISVASSGDDDANDDDLPSPLRRTLLAVISSSCSEAANLAQRGLFSDARTAYEALLTEVPLARRRAEVWVARAALESTAGFAAESMEMLLKGAEACRAVPAEHAKITSALGAFARSAITGGSTMANPIVSPLGFTSSSSTTSSSLNSAVRVLPTTSSSSNDEDEKDPFLLESLGLASSVPIIPKSDSVKKAEASYQSSIANGSLPNSSTIGFTESAAPVCMFQSPSPKKDFHAMTSIYTPPLLTSCNTGDDDGYNSPAHTVSVDTDLGLERNEEVQEEITRYKDLASPPKAVLKTTSKAARISDFIKHPSVSALKAPFTPLALSSLSSKTPLTTHRTVSRPDSKVSASFLASPQPLQPLAAVMATPAVLFSARRVPISSVQVPKTAKQFWEIEEEEGMASNDAADNVETDCTNKIEDDEEKGMAIFSAASGTTPATTGRAQRVFATTPAQVSLISSTTKASSRKKAKNTPAAGADSARRRSARLAGVSTAKTVEDEGEENGMDSLNSSLMRLAVSTLGYTHADE